MTTTRGRKTLPGIGEGVAVNETAIRSDMAESAALLSAEQLAQAMGDDRDLLNQLLGQAQMADAFAKFSVTVTTSKLAFVKENKLYQQLKGKKTGDSHQFSGTWEEFCSLIGRSREQVDEDIRNLKALGEDALASMSRMGIGYRELRQFRKLPEDQRAALIEVAKTGDKDSFEDLAEEILAKHQREKDELLGKLETKEAEVAAARSSVSASLAAKDKLIADKSKRIAELVEEKNKREHFTTDERAQELEQQLNQRVLISIGSLQPIRQAINDMVALPEVGNGRHFALQSALDRIIAEAMAIAAEYGIQLSVLDEFSQVFSDPNSGDDLPIGAGPDGE